MKRISSIMVCIVLAMVMSSCGGNVPLEDQTISLILGVDLDDDNGLMISESSPVFNKEAKKNNETHQIKAKSIRESRKYFDATTMGKVTSAKIQVLLIGKRIIEHENWFSILDTMYRNPAFSINTRVVVVDGPVSDVIFYEPEEQPHLPLFLKRMLDENMERTRTVTSNLQLLHREIYEKKGITPAIPIIEMGSDVKLAGASLLDRNGKYVDTLNIQETSFLLMLKNDKKQELTLSIPIASLHKEESIFNFNELSMDVTKLRTKVKTKYVHDRFHFHFNIDMSVNIVEQLFSANQVSKNELQEMIKKELLSRLESLIEKIQKNKIDPIGLGLYARAYEYEQYKKVKENWGEAFAKSNIDVALNIEINSMGATK